MGSGWSSATAWSSCGSLLMMAKLCNTAQAPINRHAFSGFMRISEWSRWNLRFHQPNACSMATRVLVCALLKSSCWLVTGFGYGVIRNGLHAYPLSPNRIPSSTDRCWPVSCCPMVESVNIKLSCVLPGHLATIFVNIPEMKCVDNNHMICHGNLFLVLMGTFNSCSSRVVKALYKLLFTLVCPKCTFSTMHHKQNFNFFYFSNYVKNKSTV